MRARTALTAVALAWLASRVMGCGYDYDALRGTAAGQGGRGPATGSGGIAVEVSGAAGAAPGPAGAAGQPAPAGRGGQAGAPPMPGAGGTGAGTGGHVASGGAGGAPASGGTSSGGAGGAPAAGGTSGGTGGTTGAAGASAGSGGMSSALPPVYVRYPFDQTAGPALTDASGNERGGALEGTASFGAGVVGNDLVLDGAAGTYVRLPAGLLATLRDTTIAFWARPRAEAGAKSAWQRVFDFGVDTTTYMFFTSYSADNKLAHFGITVGGNKNEQGLSAQAPLPGGTWTHVAIVLGPAGGALYVNGALAQTNSALKLRPADLGMTVNDWLGRSQFAGDPNFDGEIDELRVYAAALTPEQVAALFQQR